uniref:NADH-ubiquinone oxidoreductase chain 6 n=1 Tax=Pseudanthias dispar TaxID=1630944 RepID=A0A0N7AQX0_9TELE|nr:NADH dehydrogenase subunit 6 [Pseudanthias dispar]AJW75401.1 NADH dehydrogenase subunit 6 [Pseudanthias dispar]WNH20826.1 NADH dehydrogenase subunit 6 [Pseudanthias bicolor]
MIYFMCLFLFGLVVGLAAVASNPSPYFAALGLVGAAGLGCGALGGYGGSFLSLILFLIYLGGMLVVFAYSAALAAEPYPEGWGSRSVAMYMGLYAGVILAGYNIFVGAWSWESVLPMGERDYFSLFRGDLGGVALMYSAGGGMLVVSAWVLLLTLFVVLEVTRGLARGSIRAV